MWCLVWSRRETSLFICQWCSWIAPSSAEGDETKTRRDLRDGGHGTSAVCLKVGGRGVGDKKNATNTPRRPFHTLPYPRLKKLLLKFEKHPHSLSDLRLTAQQPDQELHVYRHISWEVKLTEVMWGFQVITRPVYLCVCVCAQHYNIC